MRFIKQSSIDNVLDEARVYDVVNISEKLKKSGIHYFCLSPFVSEKTPSFCVNVVKNYWYDNAAGYGGNAVQFLMRKHPGIGYFAAIEMTAQICNITLEFEDQSEDQKKLYDEQLAMKALVDFAAQEYQKEFHKLQPTDWPKQMMLLDRVFSEETLAEFMIGYAPNQRSFISTPAINGGNFELSKTLGYTNTKDGSSYDFFRNRIMFPIHNEKGDIIAFGGRRSNDDAEKEYAKYLNSKESKLYLKERVLYGLWQAKKNIASTGRAILLEGYTDVMALHQSGATNSVATCGTSLSEFHARLLQRYCKHVILFRDGDKAGIRAVHRDIDICLKAGLKVEAVICPDGEDPDSLSKKCEINSFIEKNKEDAILWKARFLQQEAKNPELTSLEQTLRNELDKDIESLKLELISEDDLKKLNPHDRKFKKKENDQVFKSIAELEKEMRQQLADFPKYEPSLVSHAVESMAVTLHAIPNKIAQKEYVKMVSKILDQKNTVIDGIIKSFEEQEERERKNRSQDNDKKEHVILGLPEGADKDQYLTDRFCEVKNTYWFKRDGGFMQGTNFRIIPLFHVEGRQDNKRLCEVINELGHKRLIDFESTDLINFTKIKERLIMEGFFFWEPGTTVNDFQLVAKKLLNDFITATELKILGHQKEGFFAFADGVFHNSQFLKVNKYGIVNVEGLAKTESEYRSDITHFYSPSHSEIYKSAREDDDPFENDRHFVYKIAPISLDQWMSQMVTVFADKGRFGVVFALAANFRDIFLKHYNYFPLYGGFGQKDSGKSGFGSCLQAFFYYDLNPLELNTSTLVGLSRRLTRCKNTIVFLDEARDDMDEAMHQTMKGGWNGIGREKGKGFETNRTTVDKINSAIYYAGQYLLTRDDGALASRSVISNFENKEYTPEEKEEYNKLITWNKVGISSFVLDVIKHREFVVANVTRYYAEVQKELKTALKDQEYQNRVFDDYLILVVVAKMFQDKFNFPFHYKDFLQLTKDAIIDNSETIADSDGLSAFWRIVEYLSHPNQRSIKQGEDYVIARDSSFEYVPKKGEKATWTNQNGDQVLYLYFSKVHQDYHKEVSKRQGEEVINANTIRNYLKSKKYFLGLFASKRMGDKCPSGYAFNYTMMQRLGILNLPDENLRQTEIPADFLSPRKNQIVTNPELNLSN
jgi:DNA primase